MLVSLWWNNQKIVGGQISKGFHRYTILYLRISLLGVFVISGIWLCCSAAYLSAFGGLIKRLRIKVASGQISSFTKGFHCYNILYKYYNLFTVQREFLYLVHIISLTLLLPCSHIIFPFKFWSNLKVHRLYSNLAG